MKEVMNEEEEEEEGVENVVKAGSASGFFSSPAEMIFSGRTDMKT